MKKIKIGVLYNDLGNDKIIEMNFNQVKKILNVIVTFVIIL